MTKKTIEQLTLEHQKKLDLAKRAKLEAARIKHQMSVTSRRKEAQMLCTLGRAVIRLCERDSDLDSRFRSFLVDYIKRDTDFEALSGTAFAIAQNPQPREWQ